jgi:hypothetical protein
MQLIAAQILKARLVRRCAAEGAEALDGADIAFLGPRRELADRHILDHAPTQRADGCLGHGSLLEIGSNSQSSGLKLRCRYHAAAPSSHSLARSALPRERFSPMTQSESEFRRSSRQVVAMIPHRNNIIGKPTGTAPPNEHTAMILWRRQIKHSASSSHTSTIVSMTISRRRASASGVAISRFKMRENVARFATLKKHSALLDMCRSTEAVSGRRRGRQGGQGACPT